MSPLFFKFIIISIILFIIPSFAFTATLYVDGIQYSAIQSAIDAASSGDTILVSDGTYNENITINSKSLIIKSVNGQSSTFILGDYTDSVVKYINSPSVSNNNKLNGFTIRNGKGSTSYGWTGKSSGGGILIYDSSPVIRNCIIKDNKANYGAGIYCTLASGDKACAPTIRDSTIKDNYIYDTNYESKGGGICIYGTEDNITILNNYIHANYWNNCGSYGGGIFVRQGVNSANTTVSIKDNTIDYNRAANGGGIYVEHVGNTEIIGNHIHHNNFYSVPSGSSGGGISLAYSPGT